MLQATQMEKSGAAASTVKFRKSRSYRVNHLPDPSTPAGHSF